MKLVIMGPPGSGKGTMAKMLAQHYNIEHISTGDLFRHNIRNKTELGKKVESILNSGALVPDQITMDMLKKKIEDDDVQGFILDGFPRTVKQAELLQKEVQVKKVIFLKVKDETVIQRLSLRRTCGNCGMSFHLKNIPPKKEGVCDVCQNKLVQREDEKEEVVKNRLEVYQKETLPVIDFYKKQDLLLEVDAEPTPDVIFQTITTQVFAD